MTVRIGRLEGSRALLLAAALIVPTFLTGCATSHTHLDWGVRESMLRHHVHRHAAAERRSPVTRVADRQGECVVTPKPRPGWYKDDSTPAPRDVDAGPTTAGLRFSWPLDGRVISDYGSAGGGQKNDGINIAASYGEPIHAAADGTVSYAGNDLKSYGNLVLIKHGRDYVTAYAHAERVLVSRGDHVTRGQVIAYAGSTGDVRRPQLHFEIRRGVEPVNPMPLLRPTQLASR